MNTEKQYIQAFNNGYVLAHYEPVLSNIFSQAITQNNNYLRGLLAGKAQFEVQNNKTQLLKLKKLRNKSQGRENDFGREE